MSTRKPRILLVEDDESALFGYERYLGKSGYETVSSCCIEKARERLRADRIDAVLLDLRLPDGNAMDWIPEIKSGRPELPVIVLTGISDVTTAVKAIKSGAENFLTKPIEMDDLKVALDRCIEIESLRRWDLVHRRLAEKREPYFGETEPIANLLDYSKVAAANDTVVLLQGETGTGKGVLAQWIHDRSQRANSPFVKLNCSSIRGDLLRSELFGHAKGAFTSAVKDREGLVEVADGGTLFLDEIGDMDIDVQAQLLTTIEERSYRRVGENKVRTSDFRLICATNRDLEEATRKGTFRQDLYYRICVFPIQLPALRDHPTDIPVLAEYFLSGFGYSQFPLAEDVRDLLCRYAWPGNVRELRNMLERATLLSRGEALSTAHFPGLHPSVAPADDSGDTFDLEEMEKRHILKVLKRFGGDKNKASRALGISLSALYRRLYKFEPAAQPNN